MKERVACKPTRDATKYHVDMSVKLYDVLAA